jgi:hypothetical protein
MVDPGQEEYPERKPKNVKLFGEVNRLSEGGHRETEDEKEAREKEKFNDKTLMGRIARNQIFEYICLGVICFNALYLGYDCDYNARYGKPDMLYESTLWGFMILDNAFCLWFSAEVIIRFCAYRSKWSAAKDKPFLFDLGLVLLMVVETWVLAFLGPIPAMKQVAILRLLRLARLLRMGRLMRYCPEMQLIVRGMVAAVRSVGCAAILLLLVLYVFSIIFTSTYHQGHKADDDEDLSEAEFLFGSMGRSMRHLLIMGTILDDITACCNAIRASGNMSMLMAFMVCVMVSSFTLFNMLLGILCEVVTQTQNGEQAKAEEKALNDTILNFFNLMDMDGNGMISREEFHRMESHEAIMHALEALNIDHTKFGKYAALLFTPKNPGEKPKGLCFEDATQLMYRLRPGQDVNKLDFGIFDCGIRRGNDDIRREIRELENILEEAAAIEAEAEEAENNLSNSFADFNEGVVDEDDELFKPPPTIKRLAWSNAADVWNGPPIQSKWDPGQSFQNNQKITNLIFDDSFRPGSPQSPRSSGLIRLPGHLAPLKGDVVTDRLEKLVTKRNKIENYKREAAGCVLPVQGAFYHGSSVPPFQHVTPPKKKGNHTNARLYDQHHNMKMLT